MTGLFGQENPFQVVNKVVVIMKIGGGDAVVCIATTEALANDICDGLNQKFAERVINGEI